MSVKYDKIGINYARKRQSDPRIAGQIFKHLKDAKRIVNIGAGSGSYEPANKDLIAVEPSIEMIHQRPSDALPAVQGVAESLPFPNQSFTHAMTVLSMHHWTNREQAFKEINRVTSKRFIAVSWNPEAKPFWLTRDYFPEIIEWDKKIFPRIEEIKRYFDHVEVEPLLIPEDCVDGFLAAYWKRPSAYLDEAVRNSISSFSKLSDISMRLEQLESDIKDGTWLKTNKSILTNTSIDVGYVLISANTRSSK